MFLLFCFTLVFGDILAKMTRILANPMYILAIFQKILAKIAYILAKQLRFINLNGAPYPILIIMRELSPVANKSNPSFISSKEMILDNNLSTGSFLPDFIISINTRNVSTWHT